MKESEDGVKKYPEYMAKKLEAGRRQHKRGYCNW